MLKKMIVVTLLSAAVIPASGAFAAENTSRSYIPAQQLSIEANSPNPFHIMTSTYAITGNNVNFRATPSSSGTILGSLNKGDTVNGGSEQIKADGFTWVNVYSSKYNKWGWVASQYLEEIG